MAKSVKEIEFLVGFREKKTRAVKSVADNFKHIGSEAVNMRNKMMGVSGVMSRANFTFLNLNRTISDMPFLFYDLRLGIMAVSNNILPLAESFGMLVESAGGVKGALKTLVKSFMGANGVLMAINLAVGALMFFSQTMKNSKKDAEELTIKINDMAVKSKDLKQAFDSLFSWDNSAVINGVKFTKEQVEDAVKFYKTQEDVLQSTIDSIKNSIEELEKAGIYSPDKINQAIPGEELLRLKQNADEVERLKIKLQEAQNELNKNNTYLNAFQEKLTTLNNKEIAHNELLRRGGIEIDKNAKKVKNQKDEVLALLGSWRSFNELHFQWDTQASEQALRTLKNILPTVSGSLRDTVKNMIDELEAELSARAKAKPVLLKLHANWVKFINDLDSKLDELNSSLKMKPIKISFDFDMSTPFEGSDKAPYVKRPKYYWGMFDPFKEEKKDIKRVSHMFANSVSNVFVTEMTTAWKRVFGEANSMFEKFIQNIVNTFVNMLVQKIAGQLIFSLIGNPANTGFFSFFSWLGSGTQMINNNSTQQPIVKIYLDGEELVNSTAHYLPNVLSELQAQRRL